MPQIKENILLSPFTTIRLGGPAKFFCECFSEKDVVDSILFAREKKIPFLVLAGGSNIIFPDEGYNGLIIKIGIKGIVVKSEENDFLEIKSGAGENWDDFVKFAVSQSLAGVECLSGIPGTVGATPVQNVGAYGQEVKDSIVLVRALDVRTLEPTFFSNEECQFGYRQSRFKEEDREKFIITEIIFRFSKNIQPEIKYPELQKYISEKHNNIAFSDGNDKNSLKSKIELIRNSVLELRSKKSMLFDESDPDSFSCGSFFLNPVLSENEFRNLKSSYPSVPHFKTDNGFKIPAAWLIENSGFNKGYTKNGVGISNNHSLALVNRGGTTKSLITFSSDIQKTVFTKFSIKLHPEPVIISNMQ